ncbi:hypothetical protein LUZ60_007844 [Juncus effusus]|nr:hypothetical protein LUZ60_007844 [Juncus effusus]
MERGYIHQEENPNQALVVSISSSPQQPCRDWMISDVPSDVIIEIDGIYLALHKFPLLSKCGRIRKLLKFTDQKPTENSKLQLFNVPGGIISFKLAVKFCYGINFEITTKNVAQLVCLSYYLEMLEEYSNENLFTRSESYLDTIACKNLEMCIEVLNQCGNLLPLAEELKIIEKCVDSIASIAYNEQVASSFARLEYSGSGGLNINKDIKLNDWWIEDISVLDLDMFRRVINAIKCRGVRPESIATSVINYTEKLFKKRLGYVNIYTNPSFEEKEAIEVISNLLPEDKCAIIPLTFLFGLLRSAVASDCDISCKINLERRIGSQIEKATLDDLLIPNCNKNSHDTLFDVDLVHRLLIIFSQLEENSSEDESNESVIDSPTQCSLIKVSALVDSYLAEIAPDPNLSLVKFFSVADILPSYARVLDDGLYRALDIYLKAHQSLSDMEKRRLCKLINFQKLSEDAISHAAQNDRLPVQATVQVLYIEQLKLKTSLCYPTSEKELDLPRQRMSRNTSPQNNYVNLRRENRELKLELTKMRLRLSDLEKGHESMKQDLNKSSSKKIVGKIKKKFESLSLFGRNFKGPKSPSRCSHRSDCTI